MEAMKYRELYSMLLAAKRPIFLADQKIDGDALGASLAMADWLSSQGKEVKVYVQGELPQIYSCLPRQDLITNDEAIFNEEIDLAVSFDCSATRYIMGLMEKMVHRPKLVNIDHHKSNDLYGDMNIVAHDSPATAEMVYRFFETNNLTPSKDAATLMFIGLGFDTSNFTNSATNERAFEAGSALVRYGAKIQMCISLFFTNRSLGGLKLWGKALERIRENKVYNFVCTYIGLQDYEKADVKEEEIAGFSNFLNFVTNTGAVFFVREQKEGLRISMRSIDLDVGAIAKAHGGGGHKKAGGFAYNYTSNDLENDLENLVIEWISSIDKNAKIG